MKYNLEDIPKSSVIHRSGINYSDFRTQLTPIFLIVWRDIIGGYLVLVVLITIACLIQNKIGKDFSLAVVPFSIGFGLLIGYVIAYLQLFVHEAAHYNIYPNRKSNDILANILLCTIVGINIESYRQIHWNHHRFIGKTNDSENSYFNALTIPFILQTLTGIHALRILIKRHKRIGSYPNIKYKNLELARKDKVSLTMGILLNLCILFISFYFSQWIFALSWVSAMGIFFPFFASLRQLMEHRDENANAKIDYNRYDHGIVARLFKSNILSNSFGGAGFTRHLLHHWDPHISYTQLGEVERFLLDTEQCAEFVRQSTTTYTTTFLKLLKIKFI